MAGEELQGENEAVGGGRDGLGRGHSKCQGRGVIAPGVLKEQRDRLRLEDVSPSIRTVPFALNEVALLMAYVEDCFGCYIIDGGGQGQKRMNSLEATAIIQQEVVT